jgi:hypothetical protein
MEFLDDHIKIATVVNSSVPGVQNWLKNNAEPTYRDNAMHEHLWSVDLLDDVDNFAVVIPDNIKEFVQKVMLADQHITYFRFVDL